MARPFHLYPLGGDEPKDIHADIYLQDPLFVEGRNRGIRRITIGGEVWLGEGPTSARLRVDDYDWSTGTQHRPVKVLSKGTGFAVGRTAARDNLHFHQVNVWATAARALAILESGDVFGRRIPWAFAEGRLVLHPHADKEDNAYYDRESGSLSFGYFDGLQGNTVYTCLSHDTIVHELGHAILDGLKPLYLEIDSPQVAGFHEYFGDALAMSSALTLDEIVVSVVRDAPSTLDGRNIVSDIAREFGSSFPGSTEPFLRTAENCKTLDSLRGTSEEHDYSLVLSGAFYDILQAIYARQMAHRPPRTDRRTRVQRAIDTLLSAAGATSRMMLRAVDYCPPAGLSYLDYARAVIRSDEVAYPIDVRGYREIASRVFLERTIASSADELRVPHRLRNNELWPYDVDRIAASETDAYEFVDRNREALELPRDAELHVLRVYRTRKFSAGGYFAPKEVVIEFAWPHDVRLDGARFGEFRGLTRTLWCGGALVFDTSNNLLHYAPKANSAARVRRFRNYHQFLIENDFISAGESSAGTRAKIRSWTDSDRLELQTRSRMRHAGRRSQGSRD